MASRILLLRTHSNGHYYEGIDFVGIDLTAKLVEEILGYMLEVRRQIDLGAKRLWSHNYGFDFLYAYDAEVLELCFGQRDHEAIIDGEYHLTEWGQAPGGWLSTEVDEMVVFPNGIYFQFSPKNSGITMTSDTIHTGDLHAVLVDLQAEDAACPSS